MRAATASATGESPVSSPPRATEGRGLLLCLNFWSRRISHLCMIWSTVVSMYDIIYDTRGDSMAPVQAARCRTKLFIAAPLMFRFTVYVLVVWHFVYVRKYHKNVKTASSERGTGGVGGWCHMRGINSRRHDIILDTWYLLWDKAEGFLVSTSRAGCWLTVNINSNMIRTW